MREIFWRKEKRFLVRETIPSILIIVFGIIFIHWIFFDCYVKSYKPLQDLSPIEELKIFSYLSGEINFSSKLNKY